MRRQLRSGFTILEVVIASVVLVIVLSFSMGVLLSTDQSVGESLRVSDLVVRADQTREDTIRELRNSGQYDITGFNRVTYRVCTGYDFSAGTPLYGAARRIEWVRDTTELDDGVDNDRDGLIDEGRIRLLVDQSPVDGTPETERLELARNVAEPTAPGGFATAFAAGGAAPTGGTTPAGSDTELRVTFTVMGRLPNRPGQIHMETRQFALAIRNR